MVNSFPVEQVGLYINWANTSSFIILGEFPTLYLPLKIHSSLRWLFFRCNFSVKLPWLQRRGNKLGRGYLIDIIYKTVKPSHSAKL